MIMTTLLYPFIGVLALFAILGLRVYILLPQNRQKPDAKPQRDARSTCSLGVFFGSGGHSAEMKTLLSTLDFGRYTPRRYIACHGDDMSLRMIGAVEGGWEGKDRHENWDILLLPRARRVGQPLLSTCLSTAHTLLAAVYHLFLLPLVHRPSSPYCDVLLVNGPGTCVVVVLVSWIRRVLGLSHSRIIYVESWARVKSLSLSAKLLRPFVDSFVIQWPEAAGGGRAEYHGWLV